MLVEERCSRWPDQVGNPEPVRRGEAEFDQILRPLSDLARERAALVEPSAV
jgi:hypothetical protein